MLQPAFSDCLFLVLISALENFRAAAVIDVGGRQVFVLQGKIDNMFAYLVRDVVPHTDLGLRERSHHPPTGVPAVLGATENAGHLHGLLYRQM